MSAGMTELPGSKAARDASDGSKQRIRCQYPGCQADLAAMRRFNLRCKICDLHCKADSLLINGEPHRFCQQCNKFHLETEFDKGKRGCRVKLEKHNRRRRSHRRTSLRDKPGNDKEQRDEASRSAKAMRQLVPGYDDYSQYLAVPTAGGAKVERPTATDPAVVPQGLQQPSAGEGNMARILLTGGQDTLAGQAHSYQGIEAYLAQLSRQPPTSASEPAAQQASAAPGAPHQMPPLPPGTDIAGLLEAYRDGGNRHNGGANAAAAAAAGGANGAAFQQYVLMAAYAAYLAQFPN